MEEERAQRERKSHREKDMKRKWKTERMKQEERK